MINRPIEMTKKSVPIIDMKDSSSSADKIVEACQEWGCFRMINHGVPTELMSEMKALTRSLTDLPMETKLRNAHPEPGKGYTPPNLAGPHFESLSFYDVASPQAIRDFCSQLHVSPYQRSTFPNLIPRSLHV